MRLFWKNHEYKPLILHLEDKTCSKQDLNLKMRSYEKSGEDEIKVMNNHILIIKKNPILFESTQKTFQLYYVVQAFDLEMRFYSTFLPEATFIYFNRHICEYDGTVLVGYFKNKMNQL